MTTSQQKIIKKVMPTLFIGVGGTGMQICLRIRRRILNHMWGSFDNPFSINSITEFPPAQFINFDLDSNSRTQSDKDTETDILDSMVRFSDEEKIISMLDLEKYTGTDAS